MSQLLKKKYIEYLDWSEFPKSIISREGVEIDISSEIWTLPIVERDERVNLRKISASNFRFALKKYLIHRIETVSSSAGLTAFRTVYSKIFLRHKFKEDDIASLALKMITAIESTIQKLKDDQKLHEIYHVIQWYIWCAQAYPELGFDEDYAKLLDCMVIPGGPKGEAVRVMDENEGPLHKSLELNQLVKALKFDKSTVHEHLQQKAAVALSIAFGRNPKNLTFLQEHDFENLTPESEVPCYVINMPRIKKRQLDPRDDLVTEYLDPELAPFIMELIESNKSITTSLRIDGEYFKILPKPLFISRRPNQIAIDTKQYQYAFNMYSSTILELIKKFSKRHKIFSPISNGSLNITFRRLRYTLATNLVGQGISRKELAKALDHSDTQHVAVYFDMREKIVDQLDKAIVKSFAKKLHAFQGKVIDEKSVAVNVGRDEKRLYFTNENNPFDEVEIGICGLNPICKLDPPYSCYLCPKFQPYLHADHEHVLDLLIKSKNERNQKYEQARLGVQLDDVILAVAQAVEACKNWESPSE